MTIAFNRGLPDYTAGTASVTNGSRTVTFTSANLVSTDASTGAQVQVCGRGDMFSIDGVDAIMIASVDSGGEQITLIKPWTGTTQTNIAYAITRMSIPATGSVAAAVQYMLSFGSDNEPETSLAVDNGTARQKLRINASGLPEIAVGPTGAADASLNAALRMSTSGLVSFPNGMVLPAAIQASISSQGFVNKIRNGTMDVWQRGASLTVSSSGAYAADGWFVLPTGGNVTVDTGFARKLSVNALRVTASATLSDLKVKQPIESYIAAPLSGAICTLQAQIYNGTGVAIVPTLTILAPSSTADSYSATSNVLNGVSLQSCSNGAWTQVAYTFQAPTSTAKGLEVIFDFGGYASSAYIELAEIDLRVTPGIVTGQNSSPPVPELRPATDELQFCQRYYERLSGGGHWIITTTGFSGQWNIYKATKRVVPTVNYLSSLINSGFNTPYSQFQDTSGVELIAQATSTGTVSFIALYEAIAEITP